MERAAVKLPLEMARLRLRMRFQTKFPRVSTAAASAAVKKQGAAPSAVMMAYAANQNGDFVGSSTHKINSLEHLEEARERLRSRLVRKFPVVHTSPKTQAQEVPTTLQMADHHHHQAGATSLHLEAARLRIRERFQCKLLPPNVPPTRRLNTMLQSLTNSRDATDMRMAQPDGQRPRFEPNHLPIASPSPKHMVWVAA